MLYSSGTTGRPKGIKPRGGAKRDEPNPLASLLTQLYGFDAATRYLTPAPLYHGSPTKYSMAVHRAGGTNIIMEGFDAEGRSEEHTSELQSLMRISYAVFCLKKKTTHSITRTY